MDCCVNYCRDGIEEASLLIIDPYKEFVQEICTNFFCYRRFLVYFNLHIISRIDRDRRNEDGGIKWAKDLLKVM